MSLKSLFALPLAGAAALFLTGPVLASPPCHEPPRTHTLTIYNGTCVQQQTFVQCHGSWRNSNGRADYDVFCRDCPRSSWHCHGTYASARQAEEVACSLRSRGNQVEVRRHCH
jgi:hypothetical protein